MINKQSESNVINEVVREKATEKDIMKELRKFVKWRGKQYFFFPFFILHRQSQFTIGDLKEHKLN